jgi:hydrogenase nickel incorporation protein HypB
MKTISVRKNVLAENDLIATRLRERFSKNNIFVVNIISSPGSGKTTLLERTISSLNDELDIQIIVGDVQTENDADRLRKAGGKAVQIQTNGACHLDARMIQKILEGMKFDGPGLLIIENVGNLVCPASYDLGEDVKVVILSIPEGDEKPLKYPAVFHRAGLMIIAKTDMLELSNFNPQAAYRNVAQINPSIKCIQLSAKTGEGMPSWFEWLKDNVAKKISS